MRLFWRVAAFICLLAAPNFAFSQQVDAQPSTTQPDLLRSPILTIDPELLFSGSAYGQRVSAQIVTLSEALAAQNRVLEAELTAEERSLTDRRAGMEIGAFRVEAAAFDARVQLIRQERDATETALRQRVATERETFLNAARPILGRMMIESGAAMILDRRQVFLSIDQLDMTQLAVEQIDRQIGDGETLAPGLAPELQLLVPQDLEQ
ncbi:MAG: OmpH family outer membrane protein [Rhodobacteraceae bacterium]|nr:OmpH family outer membrane protein [Paracoccaceae bacterium]